MKNNIKKLNKNVFFQLYFYFFILFFVSSEIIIFYFYSAMSGPKNHNIRLNMKRIDNLNLKYFFLKDKSLEFLIHTKIEL